MRSNRRIFPAAFGAFLAAALSAWAAPAATSTNPAAPPIIPPHRTATTRPTRSHPLDINTAAESELAKLPGVGAEGARRIVEARPFASVADLSRAGLSRETVERVAPLVKVTGAGGASTPMGAADRPMSPAPPPKASAPPRHGMVWGDPDTQTYRPASDPAAGRSEHGRWMTKSDAIAAGYREAKKRG